MRPRTLRDYQKPFASHAKKAPGFSRGDELAHRLTGKRLCAIICLASTAGNVSQATIQRYIDAQSKRD
jgi:hypothetical protein